MKQIVLFGAGIIGKRAYNFLMHDGREVAYYVDNNSQKWGECVNGLVIKRIEEYLSDKDIYELVVACNDRNYEQIKQQLSDLGITEYLRFDLHRFNEGIRLISYSHPAALEDVILYHVLKEESNLFYIDVGSNDPILHSVTKLLYTELNARGINIEPQRELLELTKIDRPGDINICKGVGEKKGILKLYIQGERSTLCSDNVVSRECETEEIEMVTLEDICNEHIEEKQQISFLKIDVEGFEKSVLQGANFNKYRPWIIVMESTHPETMDYCHEEWENILLKNKYHYVYSHSVNRYYVANERSDLDKRFLPISDLKVIYNILSVCPLHQVE